MSETVPKLFAWQYFIKNLDEETANVQNVLKCRVWFINGLLRYLKLKHNMLYFQNLELDLSTRVSVPGNRERVFPGIFFCSREFPGNCLLCENKLTIRVNLCFKVRIAHIMFSIKYP